MSVLRSRDNPRVRRWAKLVRDSGLRRREGRAIVEGPHLVAEALAAGLQPLAMLASESGLERDDIRQLTKKFQPVVLADSAFRSIADADNPPGVAAEIAIPEAKAQSSKHCVFLEGVQDPANVGAILRSAAAFGVGEVVLDRGCADAWSAKALRAGMGGHFHLSIRAVVAFADELKSFDGRLVSTLPRDGVALREADLSGRLGWIFGAEGQGVSPAAARHAALRVTIPMAPGAESLNVAAAAAICLYETYSKTPRSPAAHDPLVRGSGQ